MTRYNPRNRNERTKEAPKSTARWFDDLREDRRNQSAPCGFKMEESPFPQPKRYARKNERVYSDEDIQSIIDWKHHTRLYQRPVS